MGFVRNLRKINVGPATGKEKRGRTPKAKITVIRKGSAKGPKTPSTGSKHKSSKRSKPVGPGTRLGACKNIPITIDSDGEDAVVDDELDAGAANSHSSTSTPSSISSLQSNLSHYRYKPSSAAPSQPLGNLYSPLSDVYPPTGFLLRRSLPALSPQLSIRETGEQQHSEEGEVLAAETRIGVIKDKLGCEELNRDLVQQQKFDEGPTANRKPITRPRRIPYPSPSATSGVDVRERETSIFVGPSRSVKNDRPTTMRATTTTQLLRGAKNDTPDVTLHSNKPSSFTKVEARGSKDIDNKLELTLAEISDFDLRSKVAQLMAVAPALPLRDLYYLLIDAKGNYPVAKQRAIRASEAPPARHSVRPSNSVSSSPMVQDVASSTQGADNDEIMVKIDPNDPAFEWDTDTPEPEPAEKPRSKPRHTKPTSKSIKKHTKHLTSVKSARFTTQLSKTTIKGRPSIEVRRTNGASTTSTRARETSYDREFLVVDDGVFLISDDSFHDDSAEDRAGISSHGDTEMMDREDMLDLSIDMQPRYAFNTRLIGRKNRKPI